MRWNGCEYDRRYKRRNARTDTAQGASEQPTPKTATEPKFEPYKGKIRKPSTGCVYQINDNLWEGRFYPRIPDGKRKKFNVYAKTREECEKLLAEMIAEKKAEIAAEKAKTETV